MEAPFLKLSGVSHAFKTTKVLMDLELAMPKGEFIALLGPSGCGKSTLLRLIAGLIELQEGSIRLGDVDLATLPPHRRNIGVVFQSYALFPHLTVAQNIAFGPKAHGFDKAKTAEAVERSLKLAQLTAFADRPIAALSGGQQQRVAVARALAVGPSLILLDEPLSALDRKLRESLQFELRQLLRDLGMTAIFVTHDQEEALVMADRVAVMRGGRIEQCGPPEEVYGRPSTAFVLDFVGTSTQMLGKVLERANGSILIDTAHGKMTATGDMAPGQSALTAVRPEAIKIGPAPSGPGWNSASWEVADQIFLGARRLVRFKAPEADRLLVESAGQVAASGPVMVHWPVDATLVYPAP